MSFSSYFEQAGMLLEKKQSFKSHQTFIEESSGARKKYRSNGILHQEIHLLFQKKNKNSFERAIPTPGYLWEKHTHLIFKAQLNALHQMNATYCELLSIIFLKMKLYKEVELCFEYKCLSTMKIFCSHAYFYSQSHQFLSALRLILTNPDALSTRLQMKGFYLAGKIYKSLDPDQAQCYWETFMRSHPSYPRFQRKGIST